jgi:hypothetical protein
MDAQGNDAAARSAARGMQLRGFLTCEAFQKVTTKKIQN